MAPFPATAKEEFHPPTASDLFHKGAHFDPASIRAVLDSITPFFQEISHSVEGKLDAQAKEMSARLETLRSVIESKKKIVPAQVSAAVPPPLSAEKTKKGGKK